MTIAEQITRAKTDYDKVYEAGQGEGYYRGYHNGHENGEAVGRQAERDEFWDNVINNIEKDHIHCFMGSAWTNSTFRPNKDLVVPDWSQRYFSQLGDLDVKARLEEKRLKLDLFSKCKNIVYLVENGEGLTALPELDTRNISDLQYFVYNCPNLVSIDKVILKYDGTQKFANITSFGRNKALTHVIFEGCIGQSFSISDSPLNAESAKSVILCLKDYSGTGETHTLTLSTTTKTYLTETDIATITQKGWTLA